MVDKKEDNSTNILLERIGREAHETYTQIIQAMASRGMPSTDLSLVEKLYRLLLELQHFQTGEYKWEHYQYIQGLHQEIKVLRKLLTLLRDSDRKVGESPLYSLNPTFQTMKCVSAAIEGGNIDEIIGKLECNNLIEKGELG